MIVKLNIKWVKELRRMINRLYRKDNDKNVKKIGGVNLKHIKYIKREILK